MEKQPWKFQSRQSQFHFTKLNLACFLVLTWPGSFLALLLLVTRQVLSDSLWPHGSAAHQAPLFMGFPKQEHWSGLPSPLTGDISDPKIKLPSPASPTLQMNSLPPSHQGSPNVLCIWVKSRVTIYRFVHVSQFWTTRLFPVWFCCFLSCIQVSQESGKVAWYSHLFKTFPQFVLNHTIKGFSIVNEAEVDVFFWNSLAFSMIQQMLPIWPLIPLPLWNPACTPGSSRFMHCWSLTWRILSITLLAYEMSAAVK